MSNRPNYNSPQSSRHHQNNYHQHQSRHHSYNHEHQQPYNNNYHKHHQNPSPYRHQQQQSNNPNHNQKNYYHNTHSLNNPSNYHHQSLYQPPQSSPVPHNNKSTIPDIPQYNHPYNKNSQQLSQSSSNYQHQHQHRQYPFQSSSNSNNYRQFGNLPLHPNRPQQINLAYCIILERPEDRKYIINSLYNYYINSKRRFFFYFKTRKDLIKAIEILKKNHINFYQRESMFPDREESEEILYHCNYKYKKIDLRKKLKPTTRFRQPKDHFSIKEVLEKKQDETNKEEDVSQQEEGNLEMTTLEENQIVGKNGSMMKIEAQNNMNTDLQGSKLGGLLKNQGKPIETQKKQEPKFVAQFGDLKIKSQQVLDILQNPGLLKMLFKAQQAC